MLLKFQGAWQRTKQAAIAAGPRLVRPGKPLIDTSVWLPYPQKRGRRMRPEVAFALYEAGDLDELDLLALLA